MKTQDLNLTELREINGGSTDSSSQSGLWGSLGIDNLLTYQSASKDGDESSATGLSIGNGISTDLSRATSSMFD
jgi:hypothetical protein